MQIFTEKRPFSIDGIAATFFAKRLERATG
jgi:hypothetical protein